LIEGCKRAEIPIVDTTEVQNIATTSATSGGIISDNGGALIVASGVVWSKEDVPNTNSNKTLDNANSGTFLSTLTDLESGTFYRVRAYATNKAGTGYGETLIFKTLGQSPQATTNNVTQITDTSASLNGDANANFLSTTVTFEYGITQDYGKNISAIQTPITGNSIVSVSANITGLVPATTYHYRIKTVNALGTSYGDDKTFKTLGGIPFSTTLAATDISALSVKLNGKVNANYLTTNVVFEYGLSKSYGGFIAASPGNIAGNTDLNVTALITDLTVGETYHFRLKATNSSGNSYGEDFEFTFLYLGAAYQGGIVFHLDGTGQHGFVAATTDQSTGIQWYNGAYVNRNATEDGFLAGIKNTQRIIADQGAGNYAAQLCANYRGGGFTDWYLPSKYELNILYVRRIFVGNFSNADYWSSNFEDGWRKCNLMRSWNPGLGAVYWCSLVNMLAISVNFSNGDIFEAIQSDMHNVRAIRTF
jgi:hypothetical protein